MENWLRKLSVCFTFLIHSLPTLFPHITLHHPPPVPKDESREDKNFWIQKVKTNSSLPVRVYVSCWRLKVRSIGDNKKETFWNFHVQHTRPRLLPSAREDRIKFPFHYATQRQQHWKNIERRFCFHHFGMSKSNYTSPCSSNGRPTDRPTGRPKNYPLAAPTF